MSYLGSKAASGAAERIIASMPPHDTYIETHVGGGAIWRRHPGAANMIANDIDPEAIRAIKAAEPASAAFTAPLAGSAAPGNTDAHNTTAALFEEGPRRLYTQSDAATLLDSLEYRGLGHVLIYADPPYPHSTRTGHDRYRHEMTDTDHAALLDCLQRQATKGHAVMLSTYPNDAYAQALHGWRFFDFQAMTRGGPRTERLYLSFPPGRPHAPALHGSTFTDRQRIKRKAARWAAAIAAMPPGERATVIHAILEADIHAIDPPAPLQHSRP